MSRLIRVFSVLLACLLAAFAGPAVAGQGPTPPSTAPEPPPPLWTGSAGAGFSMNRGNTDTTNANLSFEATRGLKTPSVWKFKALYLRGQTGGAATVDRFLADGRNERDLTTRVYAFGALQFLEDKFKEIDYLWAPTGGIGYKLIADPDTTLKVDGGLGARIEKNTGFDSHTDAVVTLSDAFEHKLSPTAALTQGFNALWKANDFGDVIVAFTAGAAASITTRTQLKVEFLDSYASRPPSAAVKENDVALLTAFVYKF